MALFYNRFISTSDFKSQGCRILVYRYVVGYSLSLAVPVATAKAFLKFVRRTVTPYYYKPVASIDSADSADSSLRFQAKQTMKSSSRIEQAILERWPLGMWDETKVVVAASGGADSTALLEALFHIRPNFQKLVVAHFNHALRGEESDADQAFVEKHAERLGVRCEVMRADARDFADPSENSLRKLRHQFLVDIAIKHQSRWIAMAHHADDQVETFLHHLMRGSGPSGLSGIQAFRSVAPSIDIARPMLRVTRSEIMNYLNDRNQTFRVDRSNASSDYTRNRIRNELLPILRNFANAESLDRNLLQACELISEEHTVFKELADRWLAKAGYDFEDSPTGPQPNPFEVPIPMCRNEPWPIVREAMVILWHRQRWPMREMNHKHWRKVQKLIELASQTNHPKRLELPGHIVITCRKGVLRIDRLVAPVSPKKP